MFNAGTAGNPIVNVFGLMTGTVAATQFPDQPALLVRIKADPDNSASIFLGSTTTTCFWQLPAGVDTDWVNANNLNQFYQLAASGTMDRVQWWVQR